MVNKKANKIIQATIQLFIKEGIKTSTMDDIAAYANSSKMTVYKYFTDRDTLYYEAGKEIYTEYSIKLNNILTSEQMLIQKIYEFMNIISEFTDSGYNDLCKELTRYNLSIKKVEEEYKKIYSDTLMMLIDQGLMQKQFKDGIDRDIIYSYIDMGVEYYQNNKQYRNKMNQDKLLQDRYMTFYISNIFNNPMTT